MLSQSGQAVKEWLQAYVAFEETIDRDFERLRILEARTKGVGATEISDMPHAPCSTEFDRLAAYVIQKEQILHGIEDKIQQHNQNRQVILRSIENLTYTEGIIIRMRYLGAMSWKDIIGRLYGSRDDYKEHIDSYARSAYRQHNYGIEKMASNWKN